MKNKIIIALCLLFVPLMLLLSACGGKAAGAPANTTADNMAAESSAGLTTQSGISAATSTTDSSINKSSADVNGTTGIKAATKPSATSSITTITTTSISKPIEKPKNTVSLKITCAEAYNYMKAHNIKGYETIIPQNGIMLNRENIAIQNGDTVLGILKRITKENKIICVVRNGYVANIFGLAAADERQQIFGAQSGWLYYVNGTAPLIGAGELKVKAGDTIEFRFVCKKVNF